MKNNKQYAGVWMDSNKALIITNSVDNELQEYAIQEKIKAKEVQGVGSEHAKNNSRQSDSLKYFKTISASLLTYDEILVFGPGQSQEQFQNHLKEDAQFRSKKITIDSSGQLTDPQLAAKVRDFFSVPKKLNMERQADLFTNTKSKTS